MSVSDPLLRELKGYMSDFLQVYQKHETTSDAHPTLIPFECCLENIFYYGLKIPSGMFSFFTSCDPWVWIEKTSKLYDLDNHNYKLAGVLECVKQCCDLQTNDGRFRLMLRYCLVRKCLHLPIEQLVLAGKTSKYYTSESVIGDEILVQILLSVLYQCEKLTFILDLTNAVFLDLSWELPRILHIELVPTSNLGISVTFAGERAIILKIRSNSVASECMEMAVGDIIDSLNDVRVTAAVQGRFSSIMKAHRGKPIKLTVVKAIADPRTDCQFHPAIGKLYKEIDLDPEYVRARVLQLTYDASEFKIVKRKSSNSLFSTGFKVTYMGSVHIGRSGEAKSIDKAFATLMAATTSYRMDRCDKKKVDVMFEIGELGVKVRGIDDNRLMENHPFVEIAACGGVTLMPNYYAYILGTRNYRKEYCTSCKNFRCFIFLAANQTMALTILQAIGQGFQRTHYAV